MNQAPGPVNQVTGPLILWQSILALFVLFSVLAVLSPSGALLGLASRLTGRDVPSLPLEVFQDTALDHFFLDSLQQSVY
jgi:hypothetical protein